MTSRAPFLYKTPGAKEIMEYLRTHGPASTSTMRAAGLEVPHGLIRCMHQLGLLRAVGKVVPGNTKLWAVVE